MIFCYYNMAAPACKPGEPLRDDEELLSKKRKPFSPDLFLWEQQKSTPIEVLFVKVVTYFDTICTGRRNFVKWFNQN